MGERLATQARAMVEVLNVARSGGLRPADYAVARFERALAAPKARRLRLTSRFHDGAAAGLRA